MLLVFTFLLDQKGTQKIKHGMIAPRIRACQRLQISQGASVTLLDMVWLRLRLVDEVDTA